MADSAFDNSDDPVTPVPGEIASPLPLIGPWPTEAEIELERRLINIEQSQNRTNQLLMQLQLEYRRGINEVVAKFERSNLRIDRIGDTVIEMAGLLKKFLANGHGG